MKKLLFLLALLPIGLLGQTTFKYQVKANGGISIGGSDHSKIDSAKVVGTHFSVWRAAADYFAISDTTGLEYIDGLTSDAQDQLDAHTADIDTIQRDTVDIDDVALELYTIALQPADSIPDSTVNYTSRKQNDADSLLYKDDQMLALNVLGANLKAQPVACKISEAVVDNNDLGDGVAHYTAIYIREACTITGAYFVSADNGVFNQADFNGCALFKYGSDDTLRQVAISANDSTKWETAANTLITFPFTATYSAAPGLYYLGIVSNWTGTPSVIPELTTSGSSTTINKLAKISVYVTSVTAFPAKFKLSTATNNTHTKWGGLY